MTQSDIEREFSGPEVTDAEQAPRTRTGYVFTNLDGGLVYVPIGERFPGRSPSIKPRGQEITDVDFAPSRRPMR